MDAIMAATIIRKSVHCSDQGHGLSKIRTILTKKRKISVAHGILPRAVPCILERLCFVGLPQLCNVVCQRIVRVGCRKKSLDGEKDGSNLKSRTPLLLEDVQTDSPKLVYVWVVDPCNEPDFWSSHRVIFW